MFVVQVALVGLLAVVSEGFILDVSKAERNVVQILTVGNGQVWGHFGLPEFCPNDTYATGFSLKIQDRYVDDDETGANGVKLFCQSLTDMQMYGDITSDVSEWGTWKPQSNCNNTDVLTRFRMKVQKGQLTGDDTAVDGVEFQCRDKAGGNEYKAASSGEANNGEWGQWSTYCPEGSGICGLSTKNEGKQDIGSVIKFDDTALNDALFYCCDD